MILWNYQDRAFSVLTPETDNSQETRFNCWNYWKMQIFKPELLKIWHLKKNIDRWNYLIPRTEKHFNCWNYWKLPFSNQPWRNFDILKETWFKIEILTPICWNFGIFKIKKQLEIKNSWSKTFKTLQKSTYIPPSPY